MSLVEIFAMPASLRASSVKVAEIISEGNFDSIFLNFSRDLTDPVRSLAKGVPYDLFLKRVRELNLVPEPFNTWRYWAEPILLAIRGITNRKKHSKVWCYRLPESIRFSAKVATEVARLTLRASLTGKIKVDEWSGLIEKFMKFSRGSLEKEAKFISKRIHEEKRSICLSDMTGRILKNLLLKLGINVTLHYPFLPYHFVPIEILTRIIKFEISDKNEKDRRITQIVKNHVSFIQEYVLTSRTYDEAYFRWIKKAASWMRIKDYPLDLSLKSWRFR
ncbi:TPA: hypothetical protein EYP70_00185 [Candidatus Bathyarchaeota archaeon]|nr:hypothetical protein [Candidatus Bathyarchaeota archaeon]